MANYVQTKTKYRGVYQRESSARLFHGKPDLCFYVSYRANGKQYFKKIGWLSDGESAVKASQDLETINSKFRHGEYRPGKKKAIVTLEEVWQRYYKWAEENKADKGAHDLTRYTLHIKPRFGKSGLDQISSFALEKMKSELLKDDLSPATVKHCLVLIRQIFNKALIWNLYQGANPIKGVKLPSLNNGRERFLSYAEADTLLKALQERTEQTHDMALLALHTGMRAGEIFSLRAHDIDLTHSLISILDPKNKQARKAHMTGAVKEMLQRKTTEIGPDAYVFSNMSGEPYKEIPDIFAIVVNPLFNKGVKDRRQRVTFHNLRHTFGSWLALQGESLVTIRELMGHKSFAMTQRYAHLMPDHKKVATLGIEKAFNRSIEEKQETAAKVVNLRQEPE